MKSKEPPSALGVLRLLQAAPDGMLAGDIARSFARSCGDARPLNVEVNTILHYQLSRGRVRRGDLEPSTRYHLVPVYRWFITGAGIAYCAAGGRPAVLAAARHKGQQKAASRMDAAVAALDSLEAAIAIARQVTPGCLASRDEAIRVLRAAGLTMDAIGFLFGITRERARQVTAGKSPTACTCGQCGS
jgi:hypothetical protein